MFFTGCSLINQWLVTDLPLGNKPESVCLLKPRARLRLVTAVLGVQREGYEPLRKSDEGPHPRQQPVQEN